MELLDKLNWRYAAKAMNGTKVPQEKLTTSLKRSHLLQLSGLQPFEVIVITNQEVKEKIRPIS
jgi:nitroreductase